MATRHYDRYSARVHVVNVELAAGAASLMALREPLSVSVRTRDRDGPRARCGVLVSEDADEVLLSDSAIDALHVRVGSFSRGTWSFLGERRWRRSAPRQVWRRRR